MSEQSPPYQATAATLEVQNILASSSTSFWLKDALQAALRCDPVDAANDAEVLAAMLASRSKRTSARPFMTLNLFIGCAMLLPGLWGCGPRTLTPDEFKASIAGCQELGGAPAPIYDKDDPTRIYRVDCHAPNSRKPQS